MFNIPKAAISTFLIHNASLEVKTLHEFDLSFEVLSSQMTLDEISNALGMAGSPHSREKGAAYAGKLNRISERTYWRLFSDAGSNATLEQHFEKLLEKMRQFKLPPQDLRAALAQDCEFRICVAVYYRVEEESFLFELGREALREINRYSLDLEVCLYPG